MMQIYNCGHSDEKHAELHGMEVITAFGSALTLKTVLQGKGWCHERETVEPPAAGAALGNMASRG